MSASVGENLGGRVPGLVLGLGIMALGVLLPAPDGLSVEGFRAILLLSGAIVLWVLQPIDLAATALIGMAGIPLLGIVPAKDSFALFGNQAVFFLIGVFVLAAVLMHTGLATRAALSLLARFDSSPRRLSTAVFVLSIAGCAVLVSHVVAAILFPILLEITRALDLPHGRSAFAKRLLLSMSWGTIIGSNLTFLSSVRVGLALGLLEQHDQAHAGAPGLSLGLWMAGSSLVVVFMAIATWAVLERMHPPEAVDMQPAVTLLRRRVAEMGRVKRDEVVALLSLVVMVIGMVLYGQKLGFGTIAVLSASLNFVLGSSTFATIEKYVSWTIVLLFGGAVAMASALETTGGVEWIVATAMPDGQVPAIVLIAIVAYICVIMTEFASNSAVIAALLPVSMVLADRIGIPARVMVFATVIPAGLAFMLPTGTPAMAMVFSSGYLRPRDTVWPGLILIHLGWLTLVLAALLWWPIIGLVPSRVTP